ncbi:hypothetical protein N7492_005768 [Penicillium capsulatum]|uniref:Uncharacterized protein n=1 Tax=Penicillium capsulatum TaxID=69766 RepID=A0A9W9IA98_9EURO|nr:hypothetical protein N7492_005768 [Penicillium capsulatum]KAJ6135134.1 hypothetical protein N7512_000294 [Penicillium capsulatum]
MKHRQRHQQPSETPREQFQTPTRPNPPTTSSKRTTKANGSTSTPALTVPQKRSSLSSSRAQSTLTQIDFVTQNTQSDDEDLNYLDASVPQEKAHKVEHAHIDDDSDDAEYHPPQRVKLSASRFEMNDDHPRRRRKGSVLDRRMPSHGPCKSQTPKPSASGKAKRKSSDKSTAKRDKTLTQMDFVRRYITIDDDDDDVNMGYIQPTPAKSGDREETQESASTAKEAKWTIPQSPAKRHKILQEGELDLSTGEPISQPVNARDTNPGCDGDNGQQYDAPITPRRHRRLEIPSSQSPESPGLAIITSSQFRSATRSPLKQKSPNIAQNPDKDIKEESPSHQEIAGVSQDQGDASPKTPTPASTIPLQPSTQTTSNFATRAESYVPSTNFAPQGLPPEAERHPSLTQRERTVVYETDAESDCSDPGDEEVNPATPSQLHQTQSNLARASPGSQDDSQELPLPTVQSSTDLDSAPLSDAPMSDASIYYQRMQPATQFPHEPIPTLNTQRLSELFPNETSTQYNKPNPTSSLAKFRGPFMQTQSQSQDPEQTEIVPESSPAREQESNNTDQGEAIFQRPLVPEAVQVESSQPVDRSNNQANAMISRSQLLTSSVMESVPLPQFWMGSQDSVGEPYSLPDR